MSLDGTGGHWYTADGRPCYEVKKARGGGMRPTTLRDARKLNLYPSVTTIMKVLAAPALTYWLQTQAVLATKTVRRHKGEDDKSYARRVIQKAEEEKVTAKADKGSEIHDALEHHFTYGTYVDEYRKETEAVNDELHRLGYWGMLYEAELSFASPYGYAGKVDLHCSSVVIDFKTKDFTSEDKKPKIYDAHLMQLAAYRKGLLLAESVPGIIVFVSRTEPGLAHAVKVSPEQLDRGMRLFNCLLKT